MQRSNLEDKDKIIVFAAIACDIIIINIVFFALSKIFGISDMICERTILVNICYLLSVPGGGVTIARRMVRSDQVLITALRSSLYFILIWCLILYFSIFQHYPYSFYITCFICITVFMACGRLMARLVVNSIRNNGRNICQVVLIGAEANMLELYKQMALNKKSGYLVYGYFDKEPSDIYPKECKYLGDRSHFQEFLATNAVHRVYCGLASAESERIREIIQFCESHLIRFYRVPDLSSFIKRRVSLELFSNVPILAIRQEPLSKIENRFIKRTFDIVFSGIFLLTLFPLIFLIVAPLIKLSSKGPIFFSQKRNGIDGREFWCHKFRSMKVNDDCDTIQATEDDPRKTKIGEFMRKTNIDELPQFWNVFIGDMSVVGPRPHMLKHTKEYSELINEYMVRHLIKPGVTGWAQITGFRGETKDLSEMAGRVKADIWYMEHWNYMLDLYIIYKTVANTFTHDKKAY